MKEKIIQIIMESLAEMNQSLPADKKIDISPKAKLFEPGGRIDSLSLINLIMDLEEKIAQQFQLSLALANKDTFTYDKSPFKSIESLINYICSLNKIKSLHDQN